MINFTNVFQPYTRERTGITILFVTWVVSTLMAYFYFGVMVSVDSELYIENAHSIIRGDWPQHREFFYLTYSLLMAVLIFFGVKATWIVLFQIMVSGIALVCIYKITRRISSISIAPYIACGLYLVWYEFHQWNLIVYTDSLFANSAVIAVFLLIRSKSKWDYSLTAMLIAFVVLIRPTGIGFLLAAAGYLLYDTVYLKVKKPVLTGMVWVLFFGFSLILVNEVLGEFISSFMDSYARAEIIYPNISLGIDKPKELYIPDATYQPLIQLMLFIIHNPYYMIKISIIKGLLFLGHVKPYYSLLHNIFIVCFLYPVYYFAVKGLGSLRHNKLHAFVLIFIAFQFLTISLTSENWDGRFLLPVLPWIFIYAATGISLLLEGLRKPK